MCQSFKGVSFSFRVFFGKDGLGFFVRLNKGRRIFLRGEMRQKVVRHIESACKPRHARHQSSLIEKKRTQPNTTHQTTVIRPFFFFVLSKREKRERERERERVKK